MAKATKQKPTKKEPTSYKEKVGIKGEFLDVFKVVKEHKEKQAKKP